MGILDIAFWKDRLRASGIHLGISLAIAGLAAALVFGLWYPYPYREISGGRELFQLVVVVDVVLGPLITLAIFTRAKAWPVMRRDLQVVAVIQLLALAYGLWTVYVARPVHLVFEYDRYRVVHAIDVPQDMLDTTAPALRRLPITGPTVLGLRALKDSREKSDVTFAALAGLHLGFRPDLWQEYRLSAGEVLREGKPLEALKSRFPDKKEEIDRAVSAAGMREADLLYLPMVGRDKFWTILVDASNANVKAFLPLDPY